MNNNNEITLYAIRGLPGSGKTTLAKLFDFKFYEADQYFENFNNNKFDHSLIKKAHQNCFDNVKKELQKGNSVIVSNTMTSEEEVLEYQNLAKKLNVKFVSMVLENRHNGISVHDVPQSSIEQMQKRFNIKLN
ncbi:ATP-binding protein [Alphaproteobacteria bacterium]|nr:ATP-binding protein [Alphaproteobacteria bacterium]